MPAPSVGPLTLACGAYEDKLSLSFGAGGWPASPAVRQAGFAAPRE